MNSTGVFECDSLLIKSHNGLRRSQKEGQARVEILRLGITFKDKNRSRFAKHHHSKEYIKWAYVSECDIGNFRDMKKYVNAQRGR